MPRWLVQLAVLMLPKLAWAQENLPPQPGPVQAPTAPEPVSATSGWVYILAAIVLAVIAVGIYALVSAARARQRRRWLSNGSQQ